MLFWFRPLEGSVALHLIFLRSFMCKILYLLTSLLLLLQQYVYYTYSIQHCLWSRDLLPQTCWKNRAIVQRIVHVSSQPFKFTFYQEEIPIIVYFYRHLHVYEGILFSNQPYKKTHHVFICNRTRLRIQKQSKLHNLTETGTKLPFIWHSYAQ